MRERVARSAAVDAVLPVDGVLDAVAASGVGTVLARSAPGARVVLDFSHAREVHDLGLAALARVLSDHSGVTVVLRGLCRHHERMLRYFGVDVDPGPPRRVPEAEPPPSVAAHHGAGATRWRTTRQASGR